MYVEEVCGCGEDSRRWKAMDYALCSKLPFYLSRLRYPRINQERYIMKYILYRSSVKAKMKCK